jgi:hypothetical protein
MTLRYIALREEDSGQKMVYISLTPCFQNIGVETVP